MLLVADTNILISFFNEKSTARNLAISSSLELCSPKTALHEINKHKQDILDAFSLSEGQFSFALKLLNATVQFAETEEYRRFLSRAIRACPDPDDIDFFALAMKLGCPLWSEEKRLKKQPKVKVFSTGELLAELGLE